MKTFFIALSAPTVFKNLFFFEGSVYDRIQEHLATHPDARCVCALTQAGVVFDYFFRERPPHERFVREYVPFGKDRSFLQRLFRFFYAYFVYTGTTAVMATIGIRPDEPPAAGRFKRWLGPVKFAELRRAIESALSDPGRGREARARMVEDLCGPFDGKSSERVFDSLLGVLG